jgi:hypothetical protein
MTATDDRLWRAGGPHASQGVLRSSRLRDRDRRPQKSNISLISNASMAVGKPLEEVT